jgi:CBS domain-containing protein
MRRWQHSEVVTDTLDVGSMAVTALLGSDVIRVEPDATIAAVAKVLTDADIGAVVVGTTDTVIGIISERDVTRAVAAGRDVAAEPASAIAHTELIWCAVDATVAEVAEEMMEKWVRHVLVEDGGRLVGIVSARDLLGAYVSSEAVPD